jgi:hypothetical protein
MAISVPSATDATAKWSQNTPNSGQFYKKSVEASGAKWQQGVDDADQAYQAGVNTAISNDLYSKGVAGKSSKYVTKASTVGVTRFGPGVQAATSDFQQGIGKVLSVIGAITLPPRQGVGNNMQRAQIVADALHAAKLAGQL